MLEVATQLALSMKHVLAVSSQALWFAYFSSVVVPAVSASSWHSFTLSAIEVLQVSQSAAGIVYLFLKTSKYASQIGLGGGGGWVDPVCPPWGGGGGWVDPDCPPWGGGGGSGDVDPWGGGQYGAGGGVVPDPPDGGGGGYVDPDPLVEPLVDPLFGAFAVGLL